MKSLLLVGCGNMGSALLSRWELQRPTHINQFFVIEPHQNHKHSSAATWVNSLNDLPTSVEPNVIVFATKPQQLAEILPEYQKRFGNKPELYLSIAAGKTLAFYAKHLGTHAHVVRAMPNTPALVGAGITALTCSDTIPASSRHIATELMHAVGHVQWVEEEQMDAITALSGSGPAYGFLFLDGLTQAAIKAGVEPIQARHFATQTLAGACALASHTDDSLASLREQVTSPNGTTAAALSVLMKDDVFTKLIDTAIQKAIARSKELSE